MSNDAIVVKVGTLPGKISEVALEEGATVEDACTQAGYSDLSGYTVKLQGNTVSDPSEEEVSDGDTVLLVKQVSAG